MNVRKAAQIAYCVLLLVLSGYAVLYLAGLLFNVSSRSTFSGTELSTWWTHWQAFNGHPPTRGKLIVSAVIALAVCYGVPLAAFVAIKRRGPKLHGSARFATSVEVAKSGLLSGVGIVVGKLGRKILTFDGTEHVLLSAPTRSGKGVSVVIPNCLAWPESLVVLDVKNENFGITSKYRAENGQAVYQYAPYSTVTHRHNDLGYLSHDPNTRVSEILTIASAIYPTVGREAFWQETARNLFAGIVLYLCETPPLPVTIGEVLRQASGKGQAPKTYLHDLIRSRNFVAVEGFNDKGKPAINYEPKQWDGTGLPPLSTACVDALNRFVSAPDNTAGSIMTTFTAPLSEWANPIVDAATAANDFDLREIRKRRMTVYIGIPVNKLPQADLILRLFYAQLINTNTDDLLHALPELKYKVLLLNDEFAALGYVGIIDKAASYLAGFGIRLLTVIQSQGQIQSDPPRGYGRDGSRSLVENHALRMMFTPKMEDAAEYSEALGTYTVKARSTDLHNVFKGTQNEQARALMMPQELRDMPATEQILALEYVKPIKCNKVAYYADPIFMDRLKSVSPDLAAFGRKTPTAQEFADVWGSGDLSAPVPTLDMSLHQAIVEQRTRDMTINDVKCGFELEQIAISTAGIVEPPVENTPECVQRIVARFFDALDASSPQERPESVEAEQERPAIDLSKLETVEER